MRWGRSVDGVYSSQTNTYSLIHPIHRTKNPHFIRSLISMWAKWKWHFALKKYTQTFIHHSNDSFTEKWASMKSMQRPFPIKSKWDFHFVWTFVFAKLNKCYGIEAQKQNPTSFTEASKLRTCLKHSHFHINSIAIRFRIERKFYECGCGYLCECECMCTYRNNFDMIFFHLKIKYTKITKS